MEATKNVDDLIKYMQLLDLDVITEKEFEEKKNQIMNN